MIAPKSDIHRILIVDDISSRHEDFFKILTPAELDTFPDPEARGFRAEPLPIAGSKTWQHGTCFSGCRSTGMDATGDRAAQFLRSGVRGSEDVFGMRWSSNDPADLGG